jgi:hypothetical protein
MGVCVVRLQRARRARQFGRTVERIDQGCARPVRIRSRERFADPRPVSNWRRFVTARDALHQIDVIVEDIRRRFADRLAAAPAQPSFVATCQA